MRETTIGGTIRKIDANPFTTIVYERSFDGKHRMHDDISDLMNTSFGPMAVLPMDAILRLEYAFERSVVAGIAFPDFDHWLRSVPVEALDQSKAQENGGWVNTLVDEVVQTFFPSLAVYKNMGAEAPEESEGATSGADGKNGPSLVVAGEEGASLG